MSFTCGLLSVSKYLQPKSQIHVNVYLGLLSLAQISHSGGIQALKPRMTEEKS